MARKGQAAMEFLMTYGWAILAAIIAIGVLAYFGVFSPGKYVTGSAVVNPPFYANAWNVQADGDNDGTADDPVVNLELRNNGGEDYIITQVLITGASNGVSYSCDTGTIATTVTASGTFSPAAGVSCTGASPMTSGQTFKGDMVIKYTKSGGSTLELTSTGTIAEKVTA